MSIQRETTQRRSTGSWDDREGFRGELCWAERANLKKVHVVWFHLCNIFERKLLRWRRTDEWRPGVRGVVVRRGHRGVPWWWVILYDRVWKRGDGYTNLHTEKPHETKHVCSHVHIHTRGTHTWGNSSKLWKCGKVTFTLWQGTWLCETWPLGDDGRRCRDLLFPFLPTFCDPKYFKTGSYKKKLWLKVSHIFKNKQ